ncbi:hypothetical protein TNCV_2622591 [Trichonephila clavipes]|uniref:Uncharacterized protein n=1 Tax=Trichonephila clavipes TaxID=2585209 RepID=A0A8X6WBW0_TRICX|nr:hypothetical protein TNCV_2622591 [Trichonephila clavipes]
MGGNVYFVTLLSNTRATGDEPRTFKPGQMTRTTPVSCHPLFTKLPHHRLWRTMNHDKVLQESPRRVFRVTRSQTNNLSAMSS